MLYELHENLIGTVPPHTQGLPLTISGNIKEVHTTIFFMVIISVNTLSSLSLQEVQKKTSLFNLQVEMSGLIPGLVSTFMLLSSSDNHGRKLPMVLSSLGSLGTNIWLCVLSYFGFPLQFLIASTFIGALFGNYTTFWGACFAYIVDQCKDYKQKIIRIAVLDFMLGVVTGLTGLSSGYFIRELGFVWSYFIIAIVLTVNLTYISFFLSDPIKESSSQIVTVSCSENLKDLFYRTYLLFKNGSGKRRSLLCLLIFTIVMYFFVVIGISPIFTLYELASPLCWDAVYIGYGTALGSVSFLTSFLGIWLFSYCLEDIHIVFIGILTTVVGMTLTAFTKTTLMMLLGELQMYLISLSSGRRGSHLIQSSPITCSIST